MGDKYKLVFYIRPLDDTHSHADGFDWRQIKIDLADGELPEEAAKKAGSIIETHLLEIMTRNHLEETGEI